MWAQTHREGPREDRQRSEGCWGGRERPSSRAPRGGSPVPLGSQASGLQMVREEASSMLRHQSVVLCDHIPRKQVHPASAGPMPGAEYCPGLAHREMEASRWNIQGRCSMKRKLHKGRTKGWEYNLQVWGEEETEAGECQP